MNIAWRLVELSNRYSISKDENELRHIIDELDQIWATLSVEQERQFEEAVDLMHGYVEALRRKMSE
jgi:hypothetical protein